MLQNLLFGAKRVVYTSMGYNVDIDQSSKLTVTVIAFEKSKICFALVKSPMCTCPNDYTGGLLSK